MYYSSNNLLENYITEGELLPAGFFDSGLYEKCTIHLTVNHVSQTPCTNTITLSSAPEPSNRRLRLLANYPDGGLVSGHVLSIAVLIIGKS